MAELLINGKDALAVYGARMGDKFLSALDMPAPMKEYVENPSRLEDGKRVNTSVARVDARQVTLEFTLLGDTPADLDGKRRAFLEMLYAGRVDIKVPEYSADTFKLVYKSCTSPYGLSRNRRFYRISVKFEEPNPRDRT